MFNASKLFALAMTAGAAVAASPAAAVPLTYSNTTIVNGPTLDVGHLRFTLTGCTNQATCNSGEFVAFGNGIKIQGAGGSAFTTISSGTADTTVTFVVTELGGNLLNGMVMTDTGAGLLTNAGSNVKDSTGNVLLTSVSASAGQTKSGAFSPQAALTIITDIATGTFPSGPASTTAVTQTFNEVPEPAALTLLMAGLASLGLVRRRT